MMQFQIQANEFLSEDTPAFFHVQYSGMRQPGNPDYLNDLKNTFNDFSIGKLQAAENSLAYAALTDLQQIYETLKIDELTVCVVPRAKAEDEYHLNQQRFRWTIQRLVKKVDGLVDGTELIQRHTSTKTTHLRNATLTNYKNDYPEPYPGITAETCHISPDLKGKDILLIDDIYTPGVNVDEDVINALLNAGVNSVTFYAVGKV